ncbi:MAG: InlB B-repeat-containing protein [Paludibacteraceae bacterium]|nr:InlB B-repeat-containing protein [Paludibacteraceae bacterium]
MKKYWLLLAAAIAAVTSMAAEKITEVDKVPWEKLTNVITFDEETSTLSFYDKYRQDETIKRIYTIGFYHRDKTDSNGNDRRNSILKVEPSGGGDAVYIYGVKQGANYCIETRVREQGVPLEKVVKTGYADGRTLRTINIKDEIAACIKKGYLQLRIVIMGQEETSDGEILSYEDTGKRKQYFGSHLNNYIDVDLNYNRFNTLALFCENIAYHGSDFEIEAMIQGFGPTNYYLQRSEDKFMWWTIESGKISQNHSREGQSILFKLPFKENGYPSVYYYRLIAQDVNTGIRDTTSTESVKYVYNCYHYNGLKYLREAGETYTLPKPSDCRKYKVISDFPVQRKVVGDYIEFTQPACDVEIREDTLYHYVRFLDKDHKVLKTEIVECGSDATPPDAPEVTGYTFREWSGDVTNVHSDLSVKALYDMGDDYWFYDYMSRHKNERYYVSGFTGDKHRAMMGDTLEFTAEVRTPAESTLTYETATRNGEGEWQWSGEIMAGTFTAADAKRGESIAYKKAVAVAYDYSNEIAFRNGFAFRFCLNSAGTKIYSDLYEFEVYYPITVKSKIEQSDGTMEAVFATNSDGDVAMGAECVIPARYKDQIRITRLNNNAGGCLRFSRVNKPSATLDDGLDEKGAAWFACPGEKETVTVEASKKVVWFSGTKETQAYDFSAEGLGKYQHAYYAEVVNCGGSISKMPEDPEWEDRVFLGWKNDTWGEYADNAYLSVPAIEDNQLEFTAQWEDLPDPVYYTVNFYEQDGQTLIESKQVMEGENAVPPIGSKIPTIAGYHFAGWDKSYDMVTEDLDIKALYGEDGKEWTVTYKNWDDEVLGTEIVEDGCAAIANIKPTREHYVFAGWDEDLSHISSDITTKAQFTEELFTVSFMVDGVVTYSVQALYGFDATTITYKPNGTPTTPQKEPTATTVYTFKGWVPEVTSVTEDVTVEAVFEESVRTYEVVFQNWDYTEIDKQQVEYGKAATAPATPTRSGYSFTGWDRTFDEIKTDLVVTAQFEKKKASKPSTTTYSVKLKAVNGKITVEEDYYDLEYVPEGTELHLKAVADKGYAFKQWSDGVSTASRTVVITKDITYTAEFEQIKDGIEDVESQQPKAERPIKILDPATGEIRIVLPDGKIYNLLGAEVK